MVVVNKSKSAFRTIAEVAEDLGIAAHVLRFWETKFSQIKPMKRAGGRRYYRPDDVELVRKIQYYLHTKRYTIEGVQRVLKEKGVKKLLGEEIQKDLFISQFDNVKLNEKSMDAIKSLITDLKSLKTDLQQKLEQINN